MYRVPAIWVALPGDLPGYQKVTNPEVIAKFEKAWGVELNKKPGVHATDVFPAAIRKEIRGTLHLR